MFPTISFPKLKSTTVVFGEDYPHFNMKMDCRYHMSNILYCDEATWEKIDKHQKDISQSNKYIRVFVGLAPNVRDYGIVVLGNCQDFLKFTWYDINIKLPYLKLKMKILNKFASLRHL